MKLRNKKTGEIVERVDISIRKVGVVFNNDETYDTLVELNDEWEDYEEPKTYYYISDFGAIREGDVGKFVDDEMLRKEIGNYFGTKEEAEKAVEKLKAWKRMKECGLRFWSLDTVHLKIGYSFENYAEEDIPQLKKDLNLLFGGEE